MTQAALIFANDSWYIFKFRSHLIDRLVETRRVIIVTGDMRYAQELEKLGAEVRTIPMSPRSISPFKILQATSHFIRVIRQERPSHVFTFNPSAGLIAALASRVVRLHQVATVSGFGKYKFLFSHSPKVLKHKILRFALEQLLVKWPEISIVQNEADFDYVKATRGAHRQTIRVMGSGVDLTEFGFVERNFHTLRILFAARFLLEKGVLDYIEMARRMEGDGVAFAICGLPVENDDGLDNGQLQQAISGTGIRFLGEVSDMASLLAETDVVVLPSRYGEGIPRILIEAAARGCLTVAHDIDGVREIVMSGQTGMLTEHPDLDGLMVAMQTLVGLPVKAKVERSRAAHQLAVTKFDLEGVTNKYIGAIADT